MRNNILKPWSRMFGRLLAETIVFSAMLLTIPCLKATTLTTLGGGQPPQYYGYRNGDTLTSALFHTPCGLAIDSTGNYLFVADRDNNAVRVLQFDISYTAPLLTMTNYVSATNLFNKPIGVALDAAGNIFVLNKAKGTNGYILEFDYTRELIATNLSKITNAGGFALDASDNIYVTSSNAVIKVSSLNGVSSIVTTITASNCLLQGITVKHNGLLAVCDAGRNGILFINPNNGVVTTNAGFHGIGDFITLNDFSYSNTAAFFQPASVVETGNGTLIVSDYGNNRVKAVLPSGIVTNICGVSSNYWGGSYPGWYDHAVVIPDSVAPNAQDRLPNGVAFAPDGSIYVSEDFYHTIRKISGAGLALLPPPPPAAPTILTVTTNYGQIILTWSTVTGATNYNVERSQTSGGSYTTIGNTALTTYTDNTVSNGVTYYYVVSALNTGGESTNSAEVSATPPLPPVPDPEIGYVDFPSTSTPIAYTSVFYQVSPSSADFYNDTTIVIKGTPNTGTYYTTDGSTPTTNSSSVLSDYQDGLTPGQITSYAVPQVAPTLIVKALGAKSDGSPNSGVVQATFNFITGNPSINGDNASQFNISDITANAHLYYTIDGSDPSSTNGVDLGTVASPTNLWTVGFPILSNTLFKVRAFRDNYQPSAVESALFSPSNFVANQISFGFASGEASSAFVASPGQTFYAPVTLSLLPNTTMYSLHFNVTVTNVGPNPIVPGAFGFQSMLMKPDPNNTGYYLPIPPYMYVSTNSSVITNTVYYEGSTNFVDLETDDLSLNLLTVGWLERYTKTNLYDTVSQDLIQYSQAHDDLFLQSGGKVIVGGYAFQVPLNATANDAYQIQIGRPSATSDGIGAPGSSVYISASTNGFLAGGAINALKVVTVGQIKYIVGDVYPFNWFNAGDFGKGYLNNPDVEQVFQSAIYSLNYPPAGSDFFDGMDSCGNLGTLDGQTGYYTNNNTSLSPDQLNALFDGNNTTINQVAFGDSQLDVCDVYVTFRRSLDSSLTWYRRFWTNGVRVAETVPNVVPKLLTKSSSASGTVQSKVQNGSSVQPQVDFVAGDFIGSAGQEVQIPITATIFGSYPLRMLMLNLTVEPLDGSPALTAPVQFAQNATVLGTPYTTDSIGNGNYSAVWLNNTNAGLTGTVTIGTLTITIPPGATSISAYDVHFDHASATPNGFVSFPKQIKPGLITLSSRMNSSFNDAIPDSWRLRWFGTINNYLSASNACPTGDGISNWEKYVAGVDPNTFGDFPSLSPKSPIPAGAVCAIHWPTVNGKQYVIMSSSSLFSNNWTAIATNTGTGGDAEFDDNSAGKAQFYRVLILP